MFKKLATKVIDRNFWVSLRAVNLKKILLQQTIIGYYPQLNQLK